MNYQVEIEHLPSCYNVPLTMESQEQSAEMLRGVLANLVETLSEWHHTEEEREEMRNAITALKTALEIMRIHSAHA